MWNLNALLNSKIHHIILITLLPISGYSPLAQDGYSPLECIGRVQPIEAHWRATAHWSALEGYSPLERIGELQPIGSCTLRCMTSFLHVSLFECATNWTNYFIFIKINEHCLFIYLSARQQQINVFYLFYDWLNFIK